MNNKKLAKQITDIVLPIFRAQVINSNKSNYELYFEATDDYADSFVSFARLGTGFIFKFKAPKQDAPIYEMQVAITLKPSVTGNEWVGYNIFIDNPETDPNISIQQKWLESGGAVNTTLDEIAPLIPHIIKLVRGSALPAGEKPPRQSPAAMY